MTTSKQATLPAERPDAPPSASRQVFGSLFTPTWSLGLLIFVCLLLPSYEGCQGETIYMVGLFAKTEPTAGGVYLTFLVTWPYFFALAVSLGTVWLVIGRDAERAKLLWWSFALLITLHAALLTVAFLGEPQSEKGDSGLWSRLLDAWWLILSAVGVLILLPVSRRFCRNWFAAAQLVQLGLALAAAVSFSSLIPAFCLAQQMLVGGRIAVAGSVLLVVCTLVQMLDGHRALLRRNHESSLQLSLKATLFLMLIGGIASSWIGVYAILDPADFESKDQRTSRTTVAPQSARAKTTSN